MDRDAIRARAADACDFGEVTKVDKPQVGFGPMKGFICGTPASYQRGCHCRRCTDAHTARQRIYRNRAKARTNA